MTQPLTDAITALTTYANSVTGASDTTLSEAVATLADGYGGGGGDAITALVTGIFDKDYTFTETSIGRAFANCTGVVDIFLPNVVTLRVKNYAFENSEFNSVSMPSYADTLSTAFRGCKIKHVYAPNCTTIGERGFSGCSELLEAFYPKASSPSRWTFENCSKLKTAVIGGIANYQAFLNCVLLESVDISKNINGNKIDNTFQSCALLDTLVIRASNLITLTNLTAFTGTPFASDGTGGTLYVPNDLISTYQSASNWSTILGYANNSIKSIESTHTDPNAPIDLTLYYADGTPIE